MEAVTIPMATWLGGMLGGGAIAAGVATVVSYAVVGASIGAIGSAVMGGNIGKGALYGAIGGSVLGGFNVALGTETFQAISAGAKAMETSGFSAGMQAANAVTNGGGAVQTGVLSDGAVSQHDLGMIKGGIGSTAKNVGGGLLGGTGSAMGPMAVYGAVSGYMKKEAADDATKSQEKLAAEQREWQAQQNEADRQNRLKLQEMSGGTGALEAAKLNNEGAMARQLAAQEFQRGERKAVRGELLEDRKSFSDSVVSASKQFEAKTAQISSFLNTPAWLQPKPIVPAQPAAAAPAQTAAAQPAPAAQPAAQPVPQVV